MTARQPRQDAQDKQFGATAAADQERVDQLEDEGVESDQLPDRGRSPTPRAANRADPPEE